MSQRTCWSCQLSLAQSKFSKSQLRKKKRAARCKDCVAAGIRRGQEPPPPSVLPVRGGGGRKECSICNRPLHHSRFSQSQRRKSSPKCIECVHSREPIRGVRRLEVLDLFDRTFLDARRPPETDTPVTPPPFVDDVFVMRPGDMFFRGLTSGRGGPDGFYREGNGQWLILHPNGSFDSQDERLIRASSPKLNTVLRYRFWGTYELQDDESHGQNISMQITHVVSGDVSQGGSLVGPWRAAGKIQNVVTSFTSGSEFHPRHDDEEGGPPGFMKAVRLAYRYITAGRTIVRPICLSDAEIGAEEEGRGEGSPPPFVEYVLPRAGDRIVRPSVNSGNSSRLILHSDGTFDSIDESPSYPAEFHYYYRYWGTYTETEEEATITITVSHVVGIDCSYQEICGPWRSVPGGPVTATGPLVGGAIFPTFRAESGFVATDATKVPVVVPSRTVDEDVSPIIAIEDEPREGDIRFVGVNHEEEREGEEQEPEEEEPEVFLILHSDGTFDAQDVNCGNPWAGPFRIVYRYRGSYRRISTQFSFPEVVDFTQEKIEISVTQVAHGLAEKGTPLQVSKWEDIEATTATTDFIHGRKFLPCHHFQRPFQAASNEEYVARPPQFPEPPSPCLEECPTRKGDIEVRGGRMRLHQDGTFDSKSYWSVSTMAGDDDGWIRYFGLWVREEEMISVVVTHTAADSEQWNRVRAGGLNYQAVRVVFEGGKFVPNSCAPGGWGWD